MKTPEKLSMTLLFCLGIAALVTCSNAPVAGGAGTGNPGKTTVSIIAAREPQPSSTSTTILYKRGDADVLQISDDDNTAFTVSSARIIVDRIHFLVEQKEKDKLDNAVVHTPLHKDSESVILEGPYTFNTITGMSEPAIGTLMIPEGNYRGIKLVIANESVQSPIVLEGSFSLEDTVYHFRFDLSFKTTVSYTMPEAIHVSESDSTTFSIVLDASRWLRDISIGNCIAARDDPFDSTGTLVLNEETTGSPCTAIPQLINRNIITSGNLTARQSGVNKSEDQ